MSTVNRRVVGSSPTCFSSAGSLRDDRRNDHGPRGCVESNKRPFHREGVRKSYSQPQTDDALSPRNWERRLHPSRRSQLLTRRDDSPQDSAITVNRAFKCWAAHVSSSEFSEVLIVLCPNFVQTDLAEPHRTSRNRTFTSRMLL
jgi:hypothetical protein